jgi:hypothetical protein
VVFQLGGDAPQLPTFSKADAQEVAIVMVRACEAIEDEGERAVTIDWREAPPTTRRPARPRGHRSHRSPSR